MTLRKIEPNDIVGKTVKNVVNDSVNVVRVEFTDGTTLELWAEEAVSTPAGMIPGIFVESP